MKKALFFVLIIMSNALLNAQAAHRVQGGNFGMIAGLLPLVLILVIIFLISKMRNVHVKSLRKPIESQKEIEGGFWSFDKMVSESLIKILYILGLLSITISGFLMFQNSDLIFLGIVIIVLGNLLWRIICEGIIIIFKIFEKLNQIEKKVT